MLGLTSIDLSCLGNLRSIWVVVIGLELLSLACPGLDLGSVMLHYLLPHFSSKALVHSLPAMDPFNALSTTAARRKIPPLKEAPLAKVMSCALVASTYLEKDLDAAKEVTRGAGMPSVKMAGRPWFVAIQPRVIRAGHHQRNKVPLVPKAMECTSLMLFPLIR
jgi:hypothetical protein